MRSRDEKSFSLLLPFHVDAFFSLVKKGSFDAFPLRRSRPSLPCRTPGCPARARDAYCPHPGTHALGSAAQFRPIDRKHIRLVVKDTPRQWDSHAWTVAESHC